MIQGYRRIEGKPTTPKGHPLPLSGKPLTETPVVVKKEGVPLKEYPKVCMPAQEELGENEMRLICIGYGNPPVRRAQAATGWLVQLGNGDNFIFDVGGGTVQNLWSLEIHPGTVTVQEIPRSMGALSILQPAEGGNYGPHRPGAWALGPAIVPDQTAIARGKGASGCAERRLAERGRCGSTMQPWPASCSSPARVDRVWRNSEAVSAGPWAPRPSSEF